MTPQQEQTLRLQARARGYDKAKEDAYVQFVKSKSPPPAAPTAPAAEEPKKGDGFLKSLVKGAVAPALRVGASAYNVGAGVIEGAKTFAKDGTKGDYSSAMAKLNQERDLGFFGKAKVLDIEKPVDAAGVGAELASNFVGGSGTGALAKNSFKGLVGQGLKQGAKTGALTGGLYGAGTSLQKDDVSVGGVIKDTATGAVTGGITGGVLGGVSGGAGAAYQKLKNNPIKQTLVKKEVENLARKYEEIFTGTKSAKKGLMKSERAGKDTPMFLAKRGDIVDIEHGKINAQPVMHKVREDANALEDIYEQILQEKDRQLPTDRYINLSRLAGAVKRRLNTPANKASGNLNKMYADVDTLTHEFKEQFGDTVNLSTLNLIKRGQWQQSSVFDATKPVFSKDVNYNFGRAAKDLLEDSLDEVDVRGLNSFLGDHYDALDNLRRIDGNAVKGGRLGGYFARTVGAVAGAKAGPIGSLVGAATGDAISTIMQANYITNPVKRLILSRIPKESPVYAQAQRALMGLKISQKSLPAPKAGATKSSVNVQMNLPSKSQSTLDAQGKGAGSIFKRANEALNEVTPGLSTKGTYSVTYKKGGKTTTIKVSKEELGGWTKWLEENGFKYSVKAAGVVATAGAIKEGSD